MQKAARTKPLTVAMPLALADQLQETKRTSGIPVSRLVAIAVERLLRDRTLFLGVVHTELQTSAESGKE